MSTIIMSALLWRYLTKLVKSINYYILLNKKPAEIIRHIEGLNKGIDIGAGAGQYTAILNSMGYDVLAVEPDKKKIENSGIPFIVATGQDLPFEDKSYDFAVAINVLHHTKYPVELLLELSRVAKKVIISEVNSDNIFVRLYNQIIGEISHQHLSPRGLDSLMKAAGMKTRRIYTKSFLGIPSVFIYAVNR